MKQTEVFSMLKSTGLPVTYAEWPTGKAPSLPYIVFLHEGDDNFLADNYVYDSSPGYSIELYSKNKDIVSETKLKEAFNTNKKVWQKSYEGRTPEDLYESVFSI